MKPYLQLLKDIRDNGHDHPDRTGVGRRSIFGRQIRFNLNEGFPLVTTRKIFFRGMKEELFWFIGGKTDNSILNDAGVHIWDKWAVTEKTVDAFMERLVNKIEDPEDRKALTENPVLLDRIREEHMSVIGSIGPLYGHNWRHADKEEDPQLIQILRNYTPIEDIPSDKVEAFREAYKQYVTVKQLNEPNSAIVSELEFIQKTYATKVDQLGELLAELKNNPFSSRLLVNAWIPGYIPDPKLSPDLNVLFGRGALAPCHVMFQCFVQPPLEAGGKQRLNLMMTQRSVDTPIGLPYNIAQYALLLHLIARHVNMDVNEFIFSSGDTHIYSDQLHLVDEQLAREPRTLPRIVFNTDETDIFKINPEDIEIVGYEPHGKIDYPVAT